MSFNNDKNGLQ